MKLSLNHWTNIAEIFTSIAVVAGLIFVGVELHQNNIIAKMDTHQYVNSILIQSDFMLAKDPELNRLIRLADSEDDVLTEAEWSRYSYFVLPKIATWEFAFEAKLKGIIDEDQWRMFNQYFLLHYCAKNSGFKKIYKLNATIFVERFQKHIKETSETRCT